MAYKPSFSLDEFSKVTKEFRVFWRVEIKTDYYSLTLYRIITKNFKIPRKFYSKEDAIKFGEVDCCLKLGEEFIVLKEEEEVV